MKKSNSPHKKRTAAKRKKRSKQRKRASLKQRLARLAKNQKSFASLTAALKKAPPGALGSVEPEPEERRRRPKLGKPLVNSTVNSRDFPLHFALQQPSAQQPLSVKLNTSPLQQITGPRLVESTVVYSTLVPRWEALPRQRHYWPLASGDSVPLTEVSLLLLTHAREPNLSLLSDSSLSAAGRPTFSYSTAFKHSPEKLFHQDESNWPRSPCQSSADPRWKGSDRPDLAAVPVKPNNPALLAGNPPEVGPLSSEDKKGDRRHKNLVFEKKSPQETIRSNLNQTSKSLRITSISIRKWSRIHKNRCLQKGLGRTKHGRHCLGKPRAGCKSRYANAGNLLDRKQCVGSRWHFIRQGGLQKLLIEVHKKNNRSSHCQQFTRVSSAEMSRSHQPSLPPAPDAVPLKLQNPDLLAGNPPEAELLPSKDKKKSKEHKIFVFEEYLQETTSFSQASKHLRKTSASTGKRKDFGRTKHWQHCLGKPRSSCKSQYANAGNLLDRKQCVRSRWHLIRQDGLQQLLREVPEEDNRGSHCQQFTRVSSAEMSRSHLPRVQSSSDAGPLKPMNFAVTAANPLEAKPSSSEDKKGDIEHKKFVFKKYPQKSVRLDFNLEISAPREPLPESVKSTQASVYYPSILNGLVYGDIPVPKDISSADLDDFIQQLAQKMVALASPLGLGDGCHDHQSRSDAPASSYAAPCFPKTNRPVHAG